MEMVVCYIATKEWVNRGFLIGPICPIYGCGCLLIILLLDRYLKDPIVLFVMAMLLCSLLEYFTSYLMEKLFKTDLSPNFLVKFLISIGASKLFCIF